MGDRSREATAAIEEAQDELRASIEEAKALVDASDRLLKKKPEGKPSDNQPA